MLEGLVLTIVGLVGLREGRVVGARVGSLVGTCRERSPRTTISRPEKDGKVDQKSPGARAVRMGWSIHVAFGYVPWSGFSLAVLWGLEWGWK